MLRLYEIVLAFIIFTLEGVRGSNCGEHYAKYRGCVNRGQNGEICDNWNTRDVWGNGYWGDEDFITEDKAEENGIGDHNFCRNPENKRFGPWCYERGKSSIEKIYCPVNETNCIYTRSEDDPTCPNYSPDTTHDNGNEIPIKRMSNWNMGQNMAIPCKTDCQGGKWNTKPSRSTVTGDGILTVDAVAEDISGHWECSCGGQEYIHEITVCKMTESKCKQYGDTWLKELTSECKTEQSTNRVSCVPDSDEKSDASADAQARNNEEESGCTGSNCGFCNRNALVCGILSFSVAAIVVAAIVFVWKSMKWRKVAKKAQSTAALSANLTALSTLQSQGFHLPDGSKSHLPGSKSHLPGDKHFQDSTYLTLHHPLNRPYEMQQYLNIGGGSLPPEMSRATSMTDVTHLQELRKPGGMGRIQSQDVPAMSHDNIVCTPREYDGSGTLRFSESGRETLSTMGQDLTRDTMQNNTARRRVREFKEEEFGPRDPTLFENEPRDAAMFENEPRDAAMFENEPRDAAMFENGPRDATMFDKYYDENVERWSMQNEVQI